MINLSFKPSSPERRLSWVIKAPLGFPVVPDVYEKVYISLGFISGNA